MTGWTKWSTPCYRSAEDKLQPARRRMSAIPISNADTAACAFVRPYPHWVRYEEASPGIYWVLLTNLLRCKDRG